MRKIAIVARGGTSSLAPWQDRGWEVWGLPWITWPRMDRAFEIHSQRCVENNPDNLDWVINSDWVAGFNDRYGPIPVYCDPSRVHLFPNPVVFPIDDVIK